MQRVEKVTREILLGFWKVHILHHAGEGPIYGQWIAEELRRHGYAISPGTLYPILRRMEANGWLKAASKAPSASHARKEYRLTREGAKVLEFLRGQVREMHREVAGNKRDAGRKQVS